MQRLLLVLLAVAACAGSTLDTRPQQIHLAFAGPGGFAVSWLTVNNTDTSVVRYGVKSGSYDYQAKGDSHSYFPAPLGSWQHDVVLSNLKSDSTYYYLAGDATGGWSQERNFTTPPASNRAFATCWFGDMGTTNCNDTILRLIQRRDEFDFFFHVGDFSYADDDFTDPDAYESIWNTWALSVEPITDRKAYMTSPGNHEASCRSVGSFLCDAKHDNFTAYRNRFRMPYQESGGSNNMWYSFDYSYVHFVSVSSETDYPNSPEGPGTLWNAGPFGNQLAWLEADLAAANANRKQRPWIIVSGHRPMYSTCSSEWPIGAKQTLIDAMESLLLKYDVDIYMSAHVHGYERMWPICANGVPQTTYVNPTCPVHIVNGAAGNVEGHADFGNTQPYVVYRDSADYGFARLDVYNGTSLHWAFYRATDDTIADEFWLSKQH